MRSCLTLLLVVGISGCASTGSSPRSVGEPMDNEAADLNLKLGVGYIQSGRFDIALTKLQKAIEYDASLTEAYNALGILYEETGQERLAEQNFKKALAIDPQYLLARMNYGRFLCTQVPGKAAEGEAQFLLAANSPDLGDPEQAFNGAGLCARMQGATARAESYFQRALEFNPFYEGTLLELAVLNQEKGNFETAMDYLQRFHDRVGYQPQSLTLGISIAEDMGNSRLRQEYAQLLSSNFADSSEARRLARSE